MRIFVSSLVTAAVFSMLTLACGSKPAPRTATQPAISDPRPQTSFEEPRPQAPIEAPTPQTATIPPGSPQKPIDDPTPQKPFYGPGAEAPADRAQAKTEKPLTDAEILGAAEAANKGEVQMAEVALKKATRADVKQFATMMKTDHQKAIETGHRVAQNTKLTPATSDVATTLTTDVDKTMKELRDAKRGSEFDHAYMDAQVKAHRDVLSVIDDRLVPSVQNGEVKTMLTDMRRTVADHLVKAEEVQKKLDTAEVGAHHDATSKAQRHHTKARRAPAGKKK